MPKRKIDDKTRQKILELYKAGGVTRAALAKQFSVSTWTIGNIINTNKLREGISMADIDKKHADVMTRKRQEHAEMTTWLEHVTPLHQHKMRLETEITKRQEELDKAKQEYNNFLATVRKLMEDTT